MDYKTILKQSTQEAHNNHSASECLKHSMNADTKKRILPNIIEYQIEGISIASLLFNFIMRKSEFVGNTNIQNIKDTI